MIGIARGLASNTYIDNDPKTTLRRYRAIPNTTTRKIAWIGDSTTETFFTSSVGAFVSYLGNVQTDYCYSYLGYTGGPFYNVTHFNAGVNGASTLNFIDSSGVSGKSIADIAIFNPDLCVLSYGINDVRVGTCTKDQLKERLITCVNMLKSSCPAADIILRMPNTILYDAANAGGYIDAPNSLSKVQDYSNRIRQAYRELKGQYANVYILDLQLEGPGQLWKETTDVVANVGSLTYMSNALHPSDQGYCAIIREVGILLGEFGSIRDKLLHVGITPKRSDRSGYGEQRAIAISSTDPYLYYPRICENPKYYNLIFDGLYLASSSSTHYMDLNSNNPDITAKYYNNALLDNDIIVQYNLDDTTSGAQNEMTVDYVAAWKMTAHGCIEAGTSMRILYLPTSYPRTQKYGMNVRIFRLRPSTQKNDYDPNFNVVLAQADFTLGTLTHTVQRFGVATTITATASTGPTTGGTIDVKKNGTTFATITFANNGTTGTISGTFATADTRGAYFDEGDIITAVINAGFVGGSGLKIKISNK